MTTSELAAKQRPANQGHRWFAARYDAIIRPGERKLFSKVRPRLVGDLSGSVLEVGAGTGLNFVYYPGAAHVIATEPDPFMRQRAEDRIPSAAAKLELHDANAEELPFDDASFDHVVATLVFCTVPDARRGFSEIRRVLKPDGTFRFLEHIRNDDSRFWGKAQDVITPVWRWFGAGCHPNRRTKQAIEDAGFRIEWLEQIRVAPGTPAIYGVARPG